VNSEKYIGLDVHQATIVVAVTDSTGKLIMESILETEAATILQFFAGLRGTLSVTFEEGTWSAWLYDLLNPHVNQLVELKCVGFADMAVISQLGWVPRWISSSSQFSRKQMRPFCRHNSCVLPADSPLRARWISCLIRFSSLSDRRPDANALHSLSRRPANCIHFTKLVSATMQCVADVLDVYT
jgi:hypothetical protein